MMPTTCKARKWLEKGLQLLRLVSLLNLNQLGKRFAILFSIGKRLGSNDVVNRGVVHQKTITTDNQGSRNQILIRYGFSL